MGDLHTVLKAGDYVAVGDGSGVHIDVGHVAGPDAPAAVGDDGVDHDGDDGDDGDQLCGPDYGDADVDNEHDVDDGHDDGAW